MTAPGFLFPVWIRGIKMGHELKKAFRQIAKGIEKGIFPREPGDVQVLFDLFSTALTLRDTLNNFQDTMYQNKKNSHQKTTRLY